MKEYTFKSSHLRIGNMFRIIHPTNFEEETPLDITDIRNIHEGRGFFIYQPIPLTEEWLIRLGFKVDTTPSEYRLKWQLGKFGLMQILWMDEDCEYTFNLWNTPNGDLTYYAHGDIPHIKHVHQLQNLYFALTGEELTIKK